MNYQVKTSSRILAMLFAIATIFTTIFCCSPTALAADVDTKYPTDNITGYILATTNKTAIAYSSIGGSSIGYIYASDDCTIQTVYTNGWVKAKVPWTGYSSGRVVYTKLSYFLNTAYSPTILKAVVKSEAYSRSNLSTRLGYVYVGDNCYIVNESGNYYQVLCPWTGNTYRICWVNKSAFGNLSEQCTAYVNTSSLPLVLRQSASSSSGELANMPKGSALTVLDNKASTNGFYHVKYGSITGYASASYITFEKPSPTSALIWPTSAKYVTCLYYYKNGAKHSTRYGYKNGLDIAGGGNVYAAAAGTVETATYQSGGFGNYVVILHSDGTRTLYGHLSSYSVYTGQRVSQGQTIGVMGSTGNSSGTHLHFEWSGGDPWNAYFKMDTSLIYENNVRANNARYNDDQTIVNWIDANYRYSGGWYYKK